MEWHRMYEPPNHGHPVMVLWVTHDSDVMGQVKITYQVGFSTYNKGQWNLSLGMRVPDYWTDTHFPEETAAGFHDYCNMTYDPKTIRAHSTEDTFSQVNAEVF